MPSVATSSKQKWVLAAPQTPQQLRSCTFRHRVESSRANAQIWTDFILAPFVLFLPTQGHVTCDLEEEMSRLDTVDKASNKASQNEAEGLKGLKMLKEYIKSYIYIYLYYTCNFRVKHVQTKKLHCSALIMASEPSKRPSTSRPGYCISNILTLRQTGHWCTGQS